jgi:hypothetical protein
MLVLGLPLGAVVVKDILKYGQWVGITISSSVILNSSPFSLARFVAAHSSRFSGFSARYALFTLLA